MKTKKTVIAVLMAVLITALIISCIAPLDTAEGGKQTAPAGKTLIHLDLGNSSRTVKPNQAGVYASAANIPFFRVFVYDETAGEDVTLEAPFDTYLNYATINNSASTFTLDASGNYTIHVFGCTTNAPATSKYIAYGHETTTAAIDENIAITLKEIVGDLEYDGDPVLTDGTFSWNLTTSLTPFTTATLTLTAMDGTPVTTLDGINVKTNPVNAGIDVPAGYYYLILTLGIPKFESHIEREAVHIYSGFTTTYNDAAYKGPAALRSNVYAVSYNYGADSGHSVHAPDELTHGDVILTEITDKKPTHSGGGFSFAGWYYDALLTNAVSVGDRIMKAITLFADWVVATTSKIELSGLDLEWGNDANYGTPDWDPSSQVAWNSVDMELDLTLEVTNFSGTIASYRWYLDGVLLDTTTVSEFTGNYAWATATTAERKFWQVGEHTLLLEVDGEYGTGSYSTTFDYP